MNASCWRTSPLLILIGGFLLVIRLLPLFFQADGTLPVRDVHVSYVLLAGGLTSGCGFAPIFPGHCCGQAELERTPGYPLFLAVIRNRSIARLVQDVLGTLICIAVGLIAWREWGLSAGVIAELLIGSDVASISNSNSILSDTLFTALVTSALLLNIVGLSVRTTMRRRTAAILVTAVLIGIATLVRPIGELLVIVLPISLMMIRAYSPLRTSLLILISLIVTSIPIASWSYRNYIQRGTWIFSSVSVVNLYAYRAAGVLAHERHRPFQEVQNDLLQSLSHKTQFASKRGERTCDLSSVYQDPAQGTWIRTFDADPAEMRDRGLNILLTHPLATVIITLEGLFRNCFWIQRQALGGFLFGPEFDPGRQIRGARLSRKVLAMFSYPGLLMLLIIQSLVLALTWIGVGLAWRYRHDVSSDQHGLIIILWLFAFLLLVAAAGPEASDRFRIPAMPALALLAAYGWSAALQRISSRRLQHRAGADSPRD